MKIIGHRGARGLAPENTIASLQKALEHHVDMIEFDLRVAKDKTVVLHHDSKITDPNGNKHKISETDYHTLKQHKPDLTTFEKALDAINKKVPVYAEVKPGVNVSPVVEVINARLKNGYQPSDFRLSSYSQKTLLELDSALPEISKTVLETWSSVRAVRRAKQLNTRHIMMNRRWLWWGFISTMTRRGYKLGTFTLNNPKKAARWQRHGLRAVVTDYPDLFDKL